MRKTIHVPAITASVIILGIMTSRYTWAGASLTPVDLLYTHSGNHIGSLASPTEMATGHKDATSAGGQKYLSNQIATVPTASGTGGRGLQANATTGNGVGLVISQIYGGGGNSGASYNYDFVELYNNSSTDVDLSSFSLQYGSANSTSSFAVSKLSGTIRSGHYFLIKEQTQSSTTGSSFTADFDANAAGNTKFDLAAAAGQIALVSNFTAYPGSSGNKGDITGSETSNGIVDFVGYGTTATRFEGTGPTSSNGSATLSLSRKLFGTNQGYTDTNDNNKDFNTAAAPNPRNSQSTGIGIEPTPAPPGVVSAGIGFGVTGLSALLRRRRQSKSMKTTVATA